MTYRPRHHDHLRALIAEATDECILWDRLLHDGYGRINHTYCHRLVCEWVRGKPDDPRLQAAHTCGSRACVNPRHIRWATAKENDADKDVHGRRRHGERHNMVKLSVAQVQAIRLDPRSASVIAADYPIGASQVQRIKSGASWKALPPPSALLPCC